MQGIDFKKVQVWIAQGFGSGWAPFAPGTFGALVGVGWFLLLLVPGSVPFFVLGAAGTVAASVWLCGVAERELGETDPGSVVLDEICAMPICHAAWLWKLYQQNGALPSPSYFFQGSNWWILAGVYAAFRFCDIAKPWPVYQSQSLPGGWGITVDDVLAAVQVNLLFLVFSAGLRF